MKVHDEKISIIIPVYNAQAYISETIESVLRQTYRNWELILVDNMSGDHSLEICRTYEEKYDNIFVYQEEADAMFNSTLVYELSVLKNYAIKELDKIKPGSTVYNEAIRLKSLLSFFRTIEFKDVPENSLLREFIGGSCFYKY